MARTVRLTGGATVALCCTILAAQPLPAADDETDPRAATLKLSALLKDNQAQAAAKRADAFAQKNKLTPNNLLDLHHLFAKRQRQGLGVGDLAGQIQPDGIEAMLQKLTERELTVPQFKGEGKALQQMARHTAAIGELTLAATPPAVRGLRTPWETLSRAMRDEALQLTAALAKEDAKAVRQTARTLQDTCTKCHDGVRIGAPMLAPPPRPKDVN